MNHSYVDPGLGCIGQSFVVPVSSTGQALAQPTAPAEPCECSFDHPSSRQHLELMAVSGPQGLMDSFPCTILSPFPKIPPHGAPRREVMRHGSPRAAVAQNVHNAVDDLPEVYSTWPSPGLG